MSRRSKRSEGSGERSCSVARAQPRRRSASGSSLSPSSSSERPGTAERDLAAALLEGYSTVRDTPPARTLRWHLGASVLARVALPAVSRVRPSLLACLHPLLEGA